MHGIVQQIKSTFETIPTKYTWSVNGLMTNTKITGLKILLVLVYIGNIRKIIKNCFSYRYLNTISHILSLCHPVGSGENWRFWRKPSSHPQVT